MARSSYIYLIQIADFPIAAFTVKREMKCYLSKFQFNAEQIQLINIFRIKDNPSINGDNSVNITTEIFVELNNKNEN